MRDPKRIERVIAALRNCWLAVPDMRFGQLVRAVLGADLDTKVALHKLFHSEDDEWEAMFRKGIDRVAVEEHNRLSFRVAELEEENERLREQIEDLKGKVQRLGSLGEYGV